jgi:pimeloyl-ACP methyl ester carboxylesterase
MQKSLFIFLMLCTGPVFSQQITDTTGLQRVYKQYRNSYETLEATHGHYINTPNVRLHYMTWGDPKKLPLVWLHGTYSNAHELHEVLDSLVNIGFYVIAPEYYGHGLTPVPAKEVSLYHVADDIRTLLLSLGIKKVVMGGWSRGGSVCTAFYDAYPEMVKGLILEDGGSVAWNLNHHRSKMDSVEQNFKELFAEWKVNSYADEFAMFTNLYPQVKNLKPSATERWCYTNFSRLKKDSTGRYQANPLVRRLACQENVEQMMTMIYRPMAASTLFGASSSLLYPKIIYRNLSVPMLILDPVSADDEFDCSAENAALQQQWPKLVIHKVYVNTGHAVKFEHPSEFLADIAAFKKKL